MNWKELVLGRQVNLAKVVGVARLGRVAKLQLLGDTVVDHLRRPLRGTAQGRRPQNRTVQLAHVSMNLMRLLRIRHHELDRVAGPGGDLLRGHLGGGDGEHERLRRSRRRGRGRNGRRVRLRLGGRPAAAGQDQDGGDQDGHDGHSDHVEQGLVGLRHGILLLTSASGRGRLMV